MKNQKSVALGTVVGGVVGATAALLTAPKSGEELREDISNQLIEGKNKTEQLSEELKGKMSELTEIINESSANVSQTVKQKSEDVINEAMQLLSDVQSDDEINIDHLKKMVRELMKEKDCAGEEIKQVVENEIMEMQNTFNTDKH
ncbi:YtxH domain-containing protein [Halalkalibacter krulwichiae]|uniref:YtxH-like protein n=1 Tax=Halalkalibacter krulwichiae TaxID=199441 RepID=A0A1X9M9S1_9BACI|nr:YtxH domain-containing protein [Halalkalibacter krulwichiae]ARK30165.1 YtxH-like protein [Halalkalibacter krulwichiae]